MGLGCRWFLGGGLGMVGNVDLMPNVVIIPQNCMSAYLVACIGLGEPRYNDTCAYFCPACSQQVQHMIYYHSVKPQESFDANIIVQLCFRQSIETEIVKPQEHSFSLGISCFHLANKYRLLFRPNLSNPAPK